MDPQKLFFPQVAERLIEVIDIDGQTMDLSNSLFIVDSYSYQHHLTTALLETPSVKYVVGFNSVEFDEWIIRHADPIQNIISPLISSILLANSLSASLVLDNKINTLMTADNLLTLFHDLKESNIDINQKGIDLLSNEAQNTAKSEYSDSLELETQIVLKMVSIWNQYTQSINHINLYDCFDINNKESLIKLGNYKKVFLIGNNFPSVFYHKWLEQALSFSHVYHFALNPTITTPQSNSAKWLTICFEQSSSLLEKKEKIGALKDSAFSKLSYILLTDHEEMVDQIVDYISQSLDNGCEQLTVVSYDRKHIRRLRSKLESLGITIVDPAGWALSTTIAGTELFNVLDATERKHKDHEHNVSAILNQIVEEYTSLNSEIAKHDPAKFAINTLLADIASNPLAKSLHISFKTIRQWIESILEKETFKVPTTGSQVLITSIEHCYLSHSDKVLFTNFSEESLNSHPYPNIYMNDDIRRQLNLPNFKKRREEQFIKFRNIVLNATEVRVFLSKDVSGSNLELARWMQAIIDLKQLVSNQEVTLQQPVTTLSKIKLQYSQTFTVPRPNHFTVSELENLRICPMKYFIINYLNIKESSIQQKALLGKFIHQGLESFHNKSFSDDCTLAEIINTVRALFIEQQKTSGNNSYVNNWIKYKLDAFCKQYALYYFDLLPELMQSNTEVVLERQFGEITIKGKIDRIDMLRDNRIVLVDYKTGITPTISQITKLQKPQVVYYSLLLQEHLNEDDCISDISFLKIGKKINELRVLKNSPKKITAFKELVSILEQEINELSLNKELLIKRNRSDFNCEKCQARPVCRPNLYS